MRITGTHAAPASETSPAESCRPVHNNGFSLIELLVAMSLGVILSGAMVVAYLGAQQNALHDAQLARIQENGRYALRLVSRELTMAGFFAEAPWSQGVTPAAVGSDCSPGNWVLDMTRPIAQGDDHAGQSVPLVTGDVPLTCIDGRDIEKGTDILVVKRTAAEASLDSGHLAPGLSRSTVQSWYLHLDAGVPQGWQKVAPSELRQRASSASAESYWRAATRIFYIRPYSDSENRSDGIPTLCMESIVGNGMQSRCLVEGVEDIQLVFGIDTDSDGAPNRYLSAPTPDQLQSAVSVQVHLLLRSINPVPGWKDEKAYVLGLKNISARKDPFLRQAFSATVFLRNHQKAFVQWLSS